MSLQKEDFNREELRAARQCEANRARNDMEMMGKAYAKQIRHPRVGTGANAETDAESRRLIDNNCNYKTKADTVDRNYDNDHYY
ncbi:hypothetical protein DAMA08_017830 [Martiniozyma asiatica (nom. inval.)]|nr:hypothetical protein DAMA08_017830 [Martiniozyma asiatica]